MSLKMPFFEKKFPLNNKEHADDLFIGNVEDLDIATSMYNLLQYGENYF